MGTDEMRQLPLLDQVPAAIIAVDLESRITVWNAGAEQLYGWVAHEVLGRSVHDVVLSGQPLADEVAAVAQGGGTWTGEVEVACKDGARLLVFVRNAPLRSECGDLIGVIGASTTLSQERAAETARADALTRTSERLGSTLHRLQRLQLLSASLVGATTRADVLEAVLTAGREAMGAAAVGIALLDEETGQLRTTALRGFHAEFTSEFSLVPLTADTPLTRAYLTQELQAFGDRAATQEAFPDIPLDPEFAARAAVPILAPSGCVGGLTLSFTESRVFDTEERDLLLAVSRQAGQALDRVDLAEQQRVRQRRDAFLSRATSSLTSSLDLGHVLDSLLQLLVPEHADWAFLHLIDDDTGDYRLAAVAHHDQTSRDFMARTFTGAVLDAHDPEGTLDAIRAQRPVLHTTLSEAARARLDAAPPEAQLLPVESGLVLPLCSTGTCLGAVTLARALPAYTEADVQLLELLADRAAVALAHAAAYRQQRRSALEMQLALLPPQRPDIDGLDIGWQYRPAQLPGAAASLVGGDWYDVVPLPSHRVLLAIGDVMGRGPAAAAVMGQLRTMVRTLARRGAGPHEILGELDAELVRSSDRITTAVLLELDLDAQDLRIANAGHLPPVIHSSEGARVVDLVGAPPLGSGLVSDDVLHVQLPCAATLVLYTDGLVEERTRGLDEGIRKLLSATEALCADPGTDADTVSKQLLTSMDREAAHDDDLALLVVRLRPPR
jgi:PAS domain S-box-containing protein